MREKNKKTKKVKRKGKFLMSLGVIMLLCAVVLAVYNGTESKKAEAASAGIVEKVKASAAAGSGIAVNEHDGEKYITIDGYDYIGYLEIPSLGLDLPVMAQWDYDRLEIAPCRYYGRAETGDLVIAWHNYVSGFGKFSRIKTGDTVIFTNAENIKYIYSVDEIEILEPEDIKQMIESDWELTLYTCTYGGAKRITVRCGILK